ncbi:SMC-Scp complex subunit ScpB [Clostridium rectalis]|uniref:SMC-Scp complex subunit ScpB n=1 Tax=Clostridium rectalis TaxID=2040295 RepID=UPI000F63139F|nr:SMC-Scp complex subunit ScpB [Clostridium rectalis]
MKEINLTQIEMEEVSINNRLMSVIESLLFVSGEPLKIKEIANIIECDINFTNVLLKNMTNKYEEDDRGIKLIEIEGSYQLVTKKKNSEFIQKLLKTNVRQSLSQAALETLSIVVYKQPITRVDIDEIRGVKSDRAIQTLLEKELIKECGRLEVPGRPILYATTEEFLRHFGLENLSQMPSLESLLNDHSVKER